MFGDSITEFAFNELPPAFGKNVQFTLGAALSNAYTRKLQVVQRGFSGYTSKHAIRLVDSMLRFEHDQRPDAEKVRIAFVFFGTNDARAKGTNPENTQHVDIDDYVSNMKNITRKFQKRKIPLVVITPGLHNQKMWDEVYPEDLQTGDYRSCQLNLEYSDAVAKECLQMGVPVVHLYSAMSKYLSEHTGETSKDLLADGIHMSGMGYRIIYDELMRQIHQNFPEVYPDNIATKFPPWRLIAEGTDFEEH
ncbi:hypothetical protein FOA43_001806 [Brettanomyces nanus]|uniref:SGNH hydrolase-type esterase domain-containing protein n=1 Tax=Eeniella nana TaxID=13502 RepID=A0A875RZ88_EENNA|nr:uncharacterized protein FOA43_001806 [Brettanomyces nanus]QPG74476.1 hypothetical protein FOA43_001806 [Brettanomyces nanus]